MSEPAISVILPLRDHAETIEQALQSLRVQTRPDFEVIVVDDGSTDDGAARVEALAADDRRIRLLRQGALGLVAALNRGVAAAGAELIARMDADDLSHPKRLDRQAAHLDANTDIDVVSCRVRALDDHLEGEGWGRYLSWLDQSRTHEEIARALLIESPLAHPSVMLRRRALEAAGGYRDFDGPEDYDLWLRLLASGHRFAKVDQVLFHWRDSPRRLTRSDRRYRPAAFIEVKADYLARAGLKIAAGRPLAIWGAGRHGRLLGRALAARGVEITSYLDVDPKKIGRQRQGKPVFSPAWLDDNDQAFVIAAVPKPEARQQISAALAGRGRREGRDYLLCA